LDCTTGYKRTKINKLINTSTKPSKLKFKFYFKEKKNGFIYEEGQL